MMVSMLLLHFLAEAHVQRAHGEERHDDADVDDVVHAGTLTRFIRPR